jgi:hypothetical protein
VTSCHVILPLSCAVYSICAAIEFDLNVTSDYLILDCMINERLAHTKKVFGNMKVVTPKKKVSHRGDITCSFLQNTFLLFFLRSIHIQYSDRPITLSMILFG